MINHGTNYRYKKGCRCTQCKTAHAESTQKERKRLRKSPERLAKRLHGIYSTYAAGCRCNSCKTANTSYSRQIRGTKPRIIKHGTHNTYKKGCRCTLCKEFVKEYNRKLRVSSKSKVSRQLYRNGLSSKGLCVHCSSPLPEGRVYKICTECQRKATLNRWKRKGIIDASWERYNELQAAQNGECAICHAIPTNKALALDHDHVTYLSRGLLCSTCNQWLGIFEFIIKSPEKLSAYLNYLNLEPYSTLFYHDA